MSALRGLFSMRAAVVTFVVLFAGAGVVPADQDQFSVGLGRVGEIVSGDGSGFNHGTWYYYPHTDRLIQWFYNGSVTRHHKKIVSADLTVQARDPAPSAMGSIEVSLVWTKQTWPEDQDAPPMPDAKNPGQEQKDIHERVLVQRTDVRQSLFTSASFEIQEFCPQWIGIAVRGQSVGVQGLVRHECVSKEGPAPIDGRDFGDAPEGALAYPSSGSFGLFPTCIGTGPAAWIEHVSSEFYLGPKVDAEREGNAGLCPAFVPGVYNRDEGFNDGDAGLMKVRAYTIKGSVGFETVQPLTSSGLESLGDICSQAVWGTNVDIEVHNTATDGAAYVNVLMDWNHDGIWQGGAACDAGIVPEHVLVNFPVKAGYSGPLSLLNPPSFGIGPVPGYVWARFAITERPVATGWNGDGIFRDGETEDYLLHVREGGPVCGWDDGDSHVMHWAQLPDVRSTGIDVDMFWSPLADDFRCEQNGPITDIHFWGSFWDDILPAAGPGSLTFEINIYANKPASSLAGWSRPGDLLWTRQVRPFRYSAREIPSGAAEGWFEPTTQLFERANHKRVFQYNICFDPDDDLFIQRYGMVYWLEIREIPQQDTGYTFGWKTTRRNLQFNDAAVWRQSKQGWLPMAYPRSHEYDGAPLDLAFVITGVPTKDMDFGDAPDPAYPTLLVSDGARHIIAPGVYLGRSVDGESNGQPNATATGDDLSDDDEDGVVFTSDFVPGETATVVVTAYVPGALNAWIDWNIDGDWDDAGEQVFIDRSVNAGAATLLLDVPAGAVSGETFARFRFSTIRGLAYNGLAPDGEVEDYLMKIADVFVPTLPSVDPLKWSQPPIEQDLALRTPIYCGWDEPAYASKPLSFASGTWKLVADDFRCIGDMPVTSVHWWGSYDTWQGSEAPRIKPDAWRIAFWSNVPAGGFFSFSRPSKLLWVVSVPADRVEEVRAGIDEFPRRSSDTAFEYFLKLQPYEYFRQNAFAEADTRDGIFWISITAVYTGSPGPQYPWGWKTRPGPWMDGAVRAEFMRDDLRAGFTLSSSLSQPVADSLLCERLDKYDMAFELDTEAEYVKWEQPFTGIRHWAYYEDEQSLGTEGPNGGTTFQRIVADDWKCNDGQPITGLAWWGSYIGYGYRPCECQQMAEPRRPDHFLLSIWTDVPDPDPSNPRDFSRPGRKVWEYRARSFDEVFVGFDKHPEPTSSIMRGYEPVYRYTVNLPEDQWFRQEDGQSVYWLSVVAVYRDQKSVVYPWGWTNHPCDSWSLQGPSMLAHWKFDETAGRVAADSSGKGNDGTVFGNPLWQTTGGWVCGALDFDGRGDYVRVERPRGFDFAPSSFSVSAWIYPRETRGQWHAILEYDRDGINGNRFGLWLDLEGRFHFRVGRNTWHSQQSLAANQWHYVTAVFDAGTGTMNLYVNALLAGTANYPSGFVTPALATLIIGARGSADAEYFNGLIDDVRVFRAALTAEEILMLAGVGRNEGAVAARPGTASVAATWPWTQLLDQSGMMEDMSFVLFTEPLPGADDDDGDGHSVIIPAESAKKK